MKILLDKDVLNRTIKRMTHEIIEKNQDLNNLVFVGIKKKGVPLCVEIAGVLKTFENVEVSVEEIDINSYRDDCKKERIDNKFSVDITNKTVILFDDVLQTGRTVRAAIDAIIDLGRPDKIQLAVLVDRGHRELPIRADYVGKNIPTSSHETVVFDVNEKIVYIK